MDIENLIYIFIGVAWLIYSFIKKGKKKTHAEQPLVKNEAGPIEEYLPYEDVLRHEEIPGMAFPIPPVEAGSLDVIPQPVASIKKPKIDPPQAKPSHGSPHPYVSRGPGGGEDVSIQHPFDLKQAVIHYEILKKPEY